MANSKGSTATVSSQPPLAGFVSSEPLLQSFGPLTDGWFILGRVHAYLVDQRDKSITILNRRRVRSAGDEKSMILIREQNALWNATMVIQLAQARWLESESSFEARKRATKEAASAGRSCRHCGAVCNLCIDEIMRA